MYPNNLNNNYLDQIAPKPVSNSFLKQKPILIGAIALGVFVLICIFALIIGSLSGGTSQTKRLAAKLVNTQQVVDSAKANIKSTSLRAINSNLGIILTNTIRDAAPVLAKEKIDINKLDKNTLAKEPNTDMLARLEDARLNAVYDRTYAREMAYQLDTILVLMNEINTSSKNSSLKSFLTTATNNLAPLQKQFEQFNSNTY